MIPCPGFDFSALPVTVLQKVAHVSAYLMSRALTITVLDCIFKDVCIVNLFGRQRQHLPPEQNAHVLLVTFPDKRLRFLKLRVSPCNVIHCVCKCHWPFLHCHVGVRVQELREVLIVWILLLLQVVNCPLSLTCLLIAFTFMIVQPADLLEYKENKNSDPLQFFTQCLQVESVDCFVSKRYLIKARMGSSRTISYGSCQEGNGNPLQYSCLENPMDRGTWWATVYGSQRVRQD